MTPTRTIVTILAESELCHIRPVTESDTPWGIRVQSEIVNTTTISRNGKPVRLTADRIVAGREGELLAVREMAAGTYLVVVYRELGGRVQVWP